METDTTAEQLRAMLGAALAATPAEARGDERHHVVRCQPRQYPVELRLRYTGSAVPRPVAAGDEAARGKDEDEPGDGPVVIKGAASSTSVDWYGTEMSQGCLHDMARQFAAGVGVYPSHGGGFFGPGLGWDDEMGRTTEAELERANVAAPSDATEPGFILNCAMELDGGEPKVKSLCKRLARKQPIGLSIGGWFTEVRYITDEKGELKRIIVESVELDHLAVVRSPANPDCMGLTLLREVGDSWAVAAGATAPRGVPLPAAEEPPPTHEPAARDTGNPAEVSDVPLLDGAGSGSQDRGAQAPAAPTHDPEDDTMTPEQLRAILAETLAPVTARLDAIEARTAPPAPAAPAAPAAAPDEATGLRARVAALEAANERQRAVIGNLTSQPQRAGGTRHAPVAASNLPAYAASEFDALLNRCKAQGEDHAPAVREVVERHKPMLAVKFRSRGAEGRQLRDACEQAPDVLRELICAADADGTLADWRRLHA